MSLPQTLDLPEKVYYHGYMTIDIFFGEVAWNIKLRQDNLKLNA